MLVFGVKGDGIAMELFRMSRRAVVREKVESFKVIKTKIVAVGPHFSALCCLIHRDISIRLLRATLFFLKVEK
jgi:hypothetical protein